MSTKNTFALFLGCCLFLAANPVFSTDAESSDDTTPFTARVKPTEGTQPRWTSYYISTNEYAEYLHKDYSYVTEVKLPPKLDTAVQDFFKELYRNTYNALKLSTEDEDKIFDIIDRVYHPQELYGQFHEYMTMLNELEKMGSSIDVHDVRFRKITVKDYTDNMLTVEAIWTVHGTLHHVTHAHEQKNANCVQFRIQVLPKNELKIRSIKIVSIDPFDLYQ